MIRLIKPVSLILALLFVAAMCACGSGGGSESEAASSATEAQTDEPVAGVYTAFGMSYEEYPDLVIDSAGYIDSVITLNEDGTGLSVTEGESFGIDSWKTEGEKITVTMDGSDSTGTVKNGVMVLTFYDFSLYLAKDGADKSSVKLITVDEFEEKMAEEMPDDEAKEE